MVTDPSPSSLYSWLEHQHSAMGIILVHGGQWEKERYNQIYFLSANNQATQCTKCNPNQIYFLFAKGISKCQSKQHAYWTSKWRSNRSSQNHFNWWDKFKSQIPTNTRSRCSQVRDPIVIIKSKKIQYYSSFISYYIFLQGKDIHGRSYDGVW